MVIYRIGHDRDRSRIKLDIGFLRSPNLSATAKGILAYLLSQPDNWEFNLAQLVKAFSDDELAILEGLGELQAFGYLASALVRDRSGQTNWQIDIFETPQYFRKKPDQKEKIVAFKKVLNRFNDEAVS